MNLKHLSIKADYLQSKLSRGSTEKYALTLISDAIDNLKKTYRNDKLAHKNTIVKNFRESLKVNVGSEHRVELFFKTFEKNYTTERSRHSNNRFLTTFESLDTQQTNATKRKLAKFLTKDADFGKLLFTDRVSKKTKKVEDNSPLTNKNTSKRFTLAVNINDEDIMLLPEMTVQKDLAANSRKSSFNKEKTKQKKVPKASFFNNSIKKNKKVEETKKKPTVAELINDISNPELLNKKI